MINRGELYKLITLPARKIANFTDTPVVVLLYHRVCNLAFDPLDLAVTPGNFKNHLKHLNERYRVLTAEEFFFHLKSKKKFPKHSVLITFDDGYEDNFNEALPLLQGASMQALFYITTQTLGITGENWWDNLERIIYQDSLGRIKLQSNRSVIEMGLLNFAARQKAYQVFHSFIKKQSLDNREAIFNQLYDQAQISREGRLSHRMMSFQQFKKFASSASAVIGAHTHSHAALSSFSYEDQVNDIAMSKNILEELCGKKINHFSYPFGTRKDYNADTVRACETIGLTSSFANVYGQVRSGSSLFSMPRILVRNWNEKEFKKKMNRFFSY